MKSDSGQVRELPMGIDMAIATDRLRLIALREDHAECMFSVLADSALYEYTGGTQPASVSELRKLYAMQESCRSPDGNEIWFNWIVARQISEEVIGYVQATIREGGANVAWVIGTTWQGHGYGTEASFAMLKWLGQFGIRDIRAHIHPDNEASKRVAIKTGFLPSNAVHLGEQVWEHSKPG